MKRRLVALAVSAVLAVIGAVSLMGYVRQADRRALAGMETATVLVAVESIPAGTPADALAGLVTSKQLPASAIAETSLTSLEPVVGRVTNAVVEPGEQLVAGRFVDPAALAVAAAVPVPKGMHQVSLQLDRQRVVGGKLTAGSTVGVFFSTDERTHLTLHKVLVTDVQGGVVIGDAEQESSKNSGNDPVLVTLATTAADAEKLVFAAENARIWLSLEPSDAGTDGTRITTGKNLFP